MTKLSLSRRGLMKAAGAAVFAPMVLRHGTALAKDAVPANLTAEDRADIARIESYLNGITTMQAKFQQYTGAEGLAFGTIYVRRPGFMRVEYAPPSQVLLVADSIAISYYDAELNELNQAPLGLSPLWFLLRDDVKLGGDVTVTSFQRAPGVFQIGIQETDQPEVGKVTLVLGDHPMELQQWTIVDEKGSEVRVGLYDAQFGMKLSNELFKTPKKQPKQR